jgi:hypothetical protein
MSRRQLSRKTLQACLVRRWCVFKVCPTMGELDADLLTSFVTGSSWAIRWNHRRRRHCPCDSKRAGAAAATPARPGRRWH